MKKEKNVLEKWFEFREEELETELSEEDKNHIYDFEKCINTILNYIDNETHQYAKKKLDKLEEEILDSFYYFNRKYYITGFTDALDMILKIGNLK